MRVSHQGVRDTLAACGPLTSAEVAAFFPASPHRDVAAVLSTMRAAARKQVHIVEWTRDVHAQRAQPRPVYALGDGPDAPRPAPQPLAEIARRYRDKRRIGKQVSRGPRKIPNSVWALGAKL